MIVEDEGIDATDLLSCSPDLNPQTVQELTDGLIQVWEEIPQDTISRADLLGACPDGH